MVGKIAERREARTQEIVDVAWRLASVEGIGGFSLHAVARELGVARSTLYWQRHAASAPSARRGPVGICTKR